MSAVRSHDGTTIAYERSGSGAALSLVDGASIHIGNRDEPRAGDPRRQVAGVDASEPPQANEPDVQFRSR